MRLKRALTATAGLAPLLAPLLAACRGATEVSTVYPSLAAVYGRVTDRGGAPRPGVWVAPLGYRSPCGAADTLAMATGSPAVVAADSAGRYHAVLNTPSSTHLCVVVSVRGPAGGAVLAQATRDSVPFRIVDVAGPDQLVRDSVRLDVMVP